MNNHDGREALAASNNPLGLDGVEFIEYSTRKPQALGQVLEGMGFRPIARHRSGEVLLYRQGDMNIIVNAHGAGVMADTLPDVDSSYISAIAFRVHNAAAAYDYVLERGAWAVPSQVAVMELNIPAIHGVGSSRIYFVDRHREFSIYDVDFIPIPTVDQRPPALGRLHFLAPSVHRRRPHRRLDRVHTELFGFTPLPDDERFGVLPKGRLLRDPAGTFMLELIEPKLSLPHVGGTKPIARPHRKWRNPIRGVSMPATFVEHRPRSTNQSVTTSYNTMVVNDAENGSFAMQKAAKEKACGDGYRPVQVACVRHSRTATSRPLAGRT